MFWRYAAKLLRTFIEMTLRHGCSLVNLLHIFGTSFPRNTSERLLLTITETLQHKFHPLDKFTLPQGRRSTLRFKGRSGIDFVQIMVNIKYFHKLHKQVTLKTLPTWEGYTVKSFFQSISRNTNLTLISQCILTLNSS